MFIMVNMRISVKAFFFDLEDATCLRGTDVATTLQNRSAPAPWQGIRQMLSPEV